MNHSSDDAVHASMNRVTDETMTETDTNKGLLRLRPLGAALVFAGASFLAAPAGAASAAPDSLATINELLAQAQYQRAFEQAQAAEERYEGNPEFDFAYGMAALESGHYPEAIFALERVVFVQPNQLRVRLELARAHFLAGNYTSAQREFSRVLAQNPPPAVQANIERFLTRIEIAQKTLRRDLGAWVDARLGSDSNINSATDTGTINTPIGAFDLIADGREQDDEFVRWELGGSWREPLTKDTMLDVSGRWQQKNNFSSDTFDLGIGSIDAGYTRLLENGRYRIGARLQQVMLDTDRFQNAYGVVGTWDQSLAQNLILSLTGAVTALRYADDPDRNADQYLTSATLLKPQGKMMHSMSLYGAMEPVRGNDGEFNGRDFIGALYGLQYDGGDWQPYVRAGVQKARFDDKHPVFAKTRDDLTLTATAGLQFALWEGLVVTGETSWTDVDSNLPVFEYDRWLIEFGLRQTF
ncbi:MAG TPA: tetratricopeptide repeat protein [Pseudomonadales bacterium]|nr:tetratricopeptide repeat protein [Pseudomonadales bacterium]